MLARAKAFGLCGLILLLHALFPMRMEAAWSSASTVSSIPFYLADLAEVAVNELGNGMGVWVVHDPVSDNFSIQAAQYSSGVWSSPVTVSSIPAQGGSFLGGPLVGIDVAGNAVAIWQRFDAVADTNEIQSASFNTISWSAPVTLYAQANAQLVLNNISLSLDQATGNAIAAWDGYDNVAGNYFIQASTYSVNTASWSAAITVASQSVNTGFLQFPAVGRDTNGNGVMVFMLYNSVNGASNLQTSSFNNSTNTWTIPATLFSVSGAGSFISEVSLAINPAGDAIAAWKVYDGNSITSSLVSSFYNGIAWFPLQTINSLASTAASDLQALAIAIDDSGNGVAVWQKVDGLAGTNSIQAASFNALAWTTPITLFAGAPGTRADVPKVALDPITGNGMAIWHTHAGVQDSLLAATYTLAGNVWTPTTPIFTVSTLPSNATMNPEVAVYGVNAVAIWNTLTTSDRLNRVESSTFNGTTWSSPPTVLFTVAGRANVITNPQIGISAFSNGIALWQLYDDINDTYSIQASSYFAGHWQLPFTIFTKAALSLFENLSPKLAVNGSDNALAVWQAFETSSSDNTIQGAAFLNGNWTAPTVLFSIPLSAGTANSPGVGIDQIGNGVAVWTVKNNSTATYTIMANTFTRGMWDADETIFTIPFASGTASGSVIAINAFGHGAAAWTVKNNAAGFFNILAANFGHGVFSPPVAVASLLISGNSSISNPQIAVSATGRMAIAWQQFDSITNLETIQVSVFEHGKWSTPTVLSTVYTGGGSGASLPVVAIDDAVVVWYTYSGYTNVYTVLASNFIDGAWTPPETLFTVSGVDSFVTSPKVNMNSSGNAIAVWQAFDDTTRIASIQYATFHHGKWSAAAPLFATPLVNGEFFSVATPQIALNDRGFALSDWMFADGSNATTGVQAAAGADFFPPSPPSNFHAKKECSGTGYRLSWLPSPDDTVIGYLLCRNGKLIAEISACGPFHYIDTCPHLPAEYTLVAFNNIGKSTPVSITVK